MHIFTDESREVYRVEKLWGQPEWIGAGRHAGGPLEDEIDDDDEDVDDDEHDDDEHGGM